jgi:hypothetical protein
MSDIIDFCEQYLGVKLFWYQKIMLRTISKIPHPLFYSRLSSYKQQQNIMKQ